MSSMAATEESKAEKKIQNIQASEVTSSMMQHLDSVGLSIREHSLIEVASVESENGGKALIVTNTNGNLITKDVVVVVDEDGNIGDITAANEEKLMPRAGGTGEFNYKNKITIRATAVFEQYTHGTASLLFRPIGAYYTYSKNSSCTVSYINATYYCVGIEYTWPGFSPISYNDFEHSVEVTQDNPSPNTIYSAVNEYRPNGDRVLYTLHGEQSFGLAFKVDGKKQDAEISIITN